MTRISLDAAGAGGVSLDIPSWKLDPEFWTNVRNMRMNDKTAHAFLGHEGYISNAAAPLYATSVQSASEAFWVVGSAAALTAYDSTGASADITRTVGGAYSAALPVGWNGDFFHGYLILNNGVDDPQSWVPSLSNDAVLLANWPANTKAKVIRAYRNFLIALDVTVSGTRDPQQVRWSHAAALGTLPTSWDYADATLDASRWSLAESSGFVLDCLPLKNANVVYKEDQTWLMTYIGGVAVFRFDRVKRFDGAFSRNCAVVVDIKGEKHVVLTRDDLIVHDGVTAESLGTGRIKHALFREIDTTAYELVHLVANPAFHEVWVCYPEAGQSYCTKALVWNYRENKLIFRELPGICFSTAGNAAPLTSPADLWSTDDVTWDASTEAWDERAYKPQVPQVVMVRPDTAASNVMVADSGQTFNGTAFTTMLERTDLAVLKKDVRGEWVVDLEMRKLVTRLWPRVTAPAGTVLEVYVGARDSLDEGTPVAWEGPFNFQVGTDEFVNPLVQGRFISFRFTCTTAVAWKLTGYDFNVEPLGAY